jgi:hypothetical protein
MSIQPIADKSLDMEPYITPIQERLPSGEFSQKCDGKLRHFGTVESRMRKLLPRMLAQSVSYLENGDSPLIMFLIYL